VSTLATHSAATGDAAMISSEPSSTVTTATTDGQDPWPHP
jgi:hypothetical protein